MPKKRKSKNIPITIEKEAVSHKFRSALASSKRGQVGRPATKYNQVIALVGTELPYFIDACCDPRVTTRQLMETVTNLGVPVSYVTMTHIRKQIEQDNRWYYEMIDQIDDPKDSVRVI